MTAKKTVVIVGAGIGGVATAIKLAQNGYQVTVYEKNPSPGGRVSQTIREGHRFDLGATIFLMPEIYRDTLANLNINLDDFIEFLPMTTFQNIYVGQSPYEAPALFSMLPAAELLDGSMFPKGGMNRVVSKLVEHAESLGVQFVCNKPVSEILTEKGLAAGLLFEDNTRVEADIVVANADLPYVYSNLLPDRRPAARVNKLNHACSALVFHWAVDKVYPGLAQHNVFLSDQYHECLDTIFKDKSLSEEFCFYVHSPVRTDITAAPDGQDSLSVVIPVGHLDPDKPQDWSAIRTMARKWVIQRLEKLGWEVGYSGTLIHFCSPMRDSPERWDLAES